MSGRRTGFLPRLAMPQRQQAAVRLLSVILRLARLRVQRYTHLHKQLHMQQPVHSGLPKMEESTVGHGVAYEKGNVRNGQREKSGHGKGGTERNATNGQSGERSRPRV